eukprot:5169413-Pyramimonas_sp.AAC.1
MKGSGKQKGRIFLAGIQASATYGGEVLGHTPGEIKILRRAGAKALGFLGGALDIGWALHADHDPLNKAADTLKRYAKEWWQASDGDLLQGDGLTAREL